MIRNSRRAVQATFLAAVATLASHASATIYEWQWVDPNDQTLGKMASGTVCPGGLNVTPGPGVTLSNLNLTKAFLENQNLSSAALSNTNFNLADLRGANLSLSYSSSINASTADFSGANLSAGSFQTLYAPYSDFRNANLSSLRVTMSGSCASCDLRGANLEGANLSVSLLFSNLSDARLRFAVLTDLGGADLTDADIVGARLGIFKGQLTSTASYKAHDLRGVTAEGPSYSGVDFSNQNLSGGAFNFTDLTGANFSGANIAYGSFRYVVGLSNEQLHSTFNYQRKDLHGIYLFETTLNGLDLSGVNLQFANLSGTFNNSNFKNSDLSFSNLPGIFSGSDFTNATITGCRATGLTVAQVITTKSYLTHDLHGINFATVNFAGVDLSDQNLASCALNGSLVGAKLDRANLAGAIIGGTLTGASMIDAEIAGINFQFGQNRTVTPAQLATTANYKRHDLRGIDLTWLALAGMDFSNQNLGGTTLSYANLSGATFTDARVAEAMLTSTTPSGFTAAQLYSTSSYQQHDLHGIGVASNNLTGWDFSGQNLTGANFGGSTISGASFAGANIASANFATTTDRGMTSSLLYATPNYQAHDLRGVGLGGNDLSGWNFAGQDLTSALFYYSTLTNSVFTDANVSSANFGSTAASGFTAGQLYDTLSYKAHDLRGIGLATNNLSGWNFAGQNLTNANFNASTLTGADFTDAIIAGAGFTMTASKGLSTDQLYSTASYKAHDLRGINLGSQTLPTLHLEDQDLTAAIFTSASLGNVVFTDAIIGEATFDRTTISAAQLYSTASYKAHELHGIKLNSGSLSGMDLSAQDLTGASFRLTRIDDVNLSGACLANTNFSPSMLNVDLTGADLRGANINSASGQIGFLDKPFVIYRNIIRPDSTMDGAVWNDGETFILRDYDGSAPSGVLVNGDWEMSPGSGISIVMRDLSWNSTMRFAPGVDVSLDGALELHLADGFNASAFAPMTFQLFDWTGVTPTGSLAVVADPETLWDTSQLLSTGQVTLIAVPEPQMALLFAGFAGASMIRRRGRAGVG